LVAERSDVVGLGVGLYPDYGTAQRMYVRRGYLPDGRGVIYYNVRYHPASWCGSTTALFSCSRNHSPDLIRPTRHRLPADSNICSIFL
jgi:hypothetical protein